ncbi:hypothetical protein QYE76_018534 [Lolium multiflorum]|uniref:BTB domain-containing protein n=1 Tax=Lolium multiflorum TaxID=4521 RepID=A0AAD8PPW2_LOLMU|nr:hypothetical protein QYE76_018534 [Lolium multiflorum]
MAARDAPTRTEGPEVDAGFEFAFDNEAFSDKVLRIEVVSSRYDATQFGADVGSRKRRREEAEGDNGEGMGTPVLRVKTMYVSSAILASKSPFFFKLFSNGMKESGQSQASIRITDSDENSFMELLRFMYSGKLTQTADPTLLVNILMAADKFEVVSCMKLCGQRLITMPMTLESAVLCLDLPSSVSNAADLEEAAKQYLAGKYKEFLSTKFQDELMRIPLAGIVAILSRYDLGVASDVAVYDFMLRWAFWQYPNSEERYKILSSRLLPLVPLMRVKNGVKEGVAPDCVFGIYLMRERCSKLLLSKTEYFQKFSFMGHVFCLSAHYNMDSYNCFGLLLEMLEDKGPVRGTIDCSFQIKTRPSLEFVTMYKCTYTDSRKDVECRDLFGVPWSEFIADDSPFFIDDILNLQVHMKMAQKPL